jgi:hypothetical protein
MNNPQEAFLELLIAAMRDALREGKLTQLQTQLNPDGKGIGVVRVVIIPEKMDFKWPTYAPLGTKTKGN